MARQVRRISDLPEAAPIQGDELLEMVQGGENVRVRADQLGGGGPIGDIAIDDVQGLPEALDERVLDDDPRLSDSRVPRGGAGGVLSGQYPNPGFAVPMATAAQLAEKVGSIVAGSGITVDDSDPVNPVVSATGGGGGGIDSIVAGIGINVDDTDPANPVVSATGEAGGVLSGTYPNPTFAVDMATQAELDAVAVAKVDKEEGKGLSTNDFTTAEKNKLSGIATGATANQTDAYLLSRANHTGVQAINTVSGLQGELDSINLLIGDIASALDAINGEVV